MSMHPLRVADVQPGRVFRYHSILGREDHIIVRVLEKPWQLANGEWITKAVGVHDSRIYRPSIDALAVDRALRVFNELHAAIGALPPMSEVAGFLVAPDVWDYIAAAIPIVRGASLTINHFSITRVHALPQGAVVPVNAKGEPLEKPRTVQPSGGHHVRP